MLNEFVDKSFVSVLCVVFDDAIVILAAKFALKGGRCNFWSRLGDERSGGGSSQLMGLLSVVILSIVVSILLLYILVISVLLVEAITEDGIVARSAY